MEKSVVAVVAALAAFVGNGVAFAAYDCDSKTVGTSPKQLTVKLSKNVCLEYTAHATKSGYVVGTSHNKGTKSFGSSSAEAKIFEKTGTAAGLPVAPSGTDSTTWSGWTPL